MAPTRSNPTDASAASHWLVEDIRATMMNPDRPLATPRDEILATLADIHETYKIQAVIEQPENKDVKRSVQWFSRGLALQQLHIAELDKKRSVVIGKVFKFGQYALLAIGTFLMIIAYRPEGNDNLLWAGYLTMSLMIPVVVIYVAVWTPVRKRADEGRLLAQWISLISKT